MPSGNSQHILEVAAPADRVIRLIREPENWPLIFPPTVAVDIIERSTEGDRIRIWATANDQARQWTSTRTFTDDGVVFGQDAPAAPLQRMRGSWRVRRLDRDRCQVELAHDWDAATAADHAFITAAVETNSHRELAALADAALVGAVDETLVIFDDELSIDAPSEPILDLLWEGSGWSELLGHVDRAGTEDLSSPQDDGATVGAQVLTMTTRGADGAPHDTSSIRVRTNDGRIVYKQTSHPATLAGHCGTWSVRPAASGSVLTSRHRVRLSPLAIRTTGSAAAAQELARTTIGTNSRLTMAAVDETLRAGVR